MTNNSRTKISPIAEQVMGRIRSGEARMRPRSYYTFLSLFSSVAVVLLSFITAYFMSVATLWIRIQAASGPAYGAKRNLEQMMSSFPWWALLVGAASLVAAIYLVKKVGRMYKIRLLYLLPIMVALVFGVSLIMSYHLLPVAPSGRGLHNSLWLMK